MNVVVLQSSMTPFLKAYLITWILVCLVASALMIRHRNQLSLFSRSYRALLFQKWKLTTFIVALAGITLIAPYSGDPTWDYADAIFMSLLTFFTAPWAVAVIFRCVRYQTSWTNLYIAICVWMFSASWSYDGYLLLRDGIYPITWYSNIFASSILYFCAGLFWSLEWKEGRGVHFSFTENHWPQLPAEYSFTKVAWCGLPFMLLVTVSLGSFLI